MTTKLLMSALIATGLALSPAAFAQGMKKDEMRPMMDDKKGDAMKKGDDMKKGDAMKKGDDKMMQK